MKKKTKFLYCFNSKFREKEISYDISKETNLNEKSDTESDNNDEKQEDIIIFYN